MEAKQLIESYSPCCPRIAFFEVDDTSAFFYIGDSEKQEIISACFVANVKSVDDAISHEEWENGGYATTPMLDYKFVNHSTNGMQFDNNIENYEVVWTQEGTGAGLYYMGELLAYIPEWANDEMPGYSKYVSVITEYAYPLADAFEPISNRLNEARNFWSGFDYGTWWQDIQDGYLDSIEEYIGKIDKYYAIDGGEFPPMALVTSITDELCYAMTLGVSIVRLPLTEVYYQEDYKEFSRIELGFVCTKEYEEYFSAISDELSAIASYPWNTVTPLGHGHTVVSHAIPNYPILWLINANMLSEKCRPNFDIIYGDRVNLLWAVPITQDEFDFLSSCDMEQVFNAELPDDIMIFDGTKKNDIIKLLKLTN